MINKKVQLTQTHKVNINKKFKLEKIKKDKRTNRREKEKRIKKQR